MHFKITPCKIPNGGHCIKIVVCWHILEILSDISCETSPFDKYK